VFSKQIKLTKTFFNLGFFSPHIFLLYTKEKDCFVVQYLSCPTKEILRFANGFFKVKFCLTQRVIKAPQRSQVPSAERTSFVQQEQACSVSATCVIS
jgi:hypothetical protein